jgi:hypothetical protein
MNRAVAELVLEQELTKLLDWGHKRLCRQIGAEPIEKVVTGPDGRPYIVEISAYWDGPENGPVRLIAVIDDGGWPAFLLPLTADCVVDTNWQAAD